MTGIKEVAAGNCRGTYLKKKGLENSRTNCTKKTEKNPKLNRNLKYGYFGSYKVSRTHCDSKLGYVKVHEICSSGRRLQQDL